MNDNLVTIEQTQEFYEFLQGKIPKGHMIVFLDKNRKNCDVGNLYCTTRAINFMMAKNKWYSSNPELTLAALKWCELFYAMKGEKDGEIN